MPKAQRARLREVTVQVELRLSVRVENTPVWLDRGTGGGRLPGLVEGLEHEGVDTPASHGADTVLPEGSSVVDGRHGGAEVGALGWPAGLTDPEVDVGGALGGLGDLEGLHDVVEEGEGRVGHGLALPVGEGVGVEDVGDSERRVGGPVHQLVPGVDSADGDVAVGVAVLVLDLAQQLLDFGDHGRELVTGHVVSVQGLGTHQDVHDGVLGDERQVVLQGLLLEVELVGRSRPDAQG